MPLGNFISVDGPNGVGKSTLVQATAAVLKAKGLTVHLTKEVTTTSLGRFIRDTHSEYRGKTLALLLAADRENHVETDIRPALATHDFVITDRYINSSLVYQQLDGVEMEFLWRLNERFLRPHLSISVTADPETIAARMEGRDTLDRFEQAFSREDEIRLFGEAATFLRQRGFKVFGFLNDAGPIDRAAATIVEVILSARA